MASEVEKLNEQLNTGIIKTISDPLVQLGMPFNIAVPLAFILVCTAFAVVISAFKKSKRRGVDTDSVWHRLNVDDDAMIQTVWAKPGSAKAVARITKNKPATSIEEFKRQIRKLQKRA